MKTELHSKRFIKTFGEKMYRDFIRYRDIGLNAREIGKLLEINRETVYRWIGRFEEDKINLILE